MSRQVSTTLNNFIIQYDNKYLSDSSDGAVEHPRSHISMVQNIRLIWLDNTIDENSADYRNNIIQLRSIVNTINTFTDGDQCIQFLDSIGDENVCMIISDSLGQHIMPRIHGISQVNSIFILSTDQKSYEEWSKIRGVFKEIPLICEALKQVGHECERNAIPISFIPNNGDLFAKPLNHMNLLFIYSQLFKEISLSLQSERHHLKQFVRYCRGAFSHNDKVLSSIKKFKRRYHNETPIWWCTSEPFLYPLLNRALRKMDMEVIIKMDFFIGDLHRHIEQMHSEPLIMQNNGSIKVMVYRGQGMTKTNFEQMTKMKGGLLSFNNFLYTNRDHNAPLHFARVAMKNPDLVGIFFVITIDPLKSTSPFASINKVNGEQVKHDKILFPMHTVFRIGDIKSMDEQHPLYQVNLTLTGDTDEDLRKITDRIRKETFPQKEGWYRLTSFLLKIGQVDKAQCVYQVLLEQTNKPSDKATIYGQLGLTKYGQGKYKDAITFYEKSLESYKEIFPLNYSNLTGSYSNIGNVYNQMGNYAKALSLYEQALAIQRQILPPNHPDLGLSYSNIGLMLGKMNEYTKAVSYYQKALEIQQQSLPSNHPDLIASYNNIGTMYNEMGLYSEALRFYEKALVIRTQSLPPDHPDLRMSYTNVGYVYHCMGEYAKALSYYDAAIKIQQKSLPSNHPDLASSYSKLGGVYLDMGDFAQALSFYKKALDIRQKSLPSNHPHLGESHNNIGNVYFNMDQYPQALSSYQKAFEIRQQSLPPNHPGLGSSYNNIGAVYEKMNDYSKALSFYEKALDIRQKSLPPNHPDLALSYSNIGVVYDKMGQYEKALSSYEKGIQIQQQSLPPNHPDLASSYSNIGAMYEDMKNYPQALSFYEKALKIRQQSLPPNHPDLSVSYNNVGVLYHRMKEFTKALSHYEAEIQIQQQTLPPNHPDFASSSNKLGALYEDMGNYSKARSYYGRAVHIGRHSLPADHPHLKLYKKNLDDVTKKL